MEQAVGAMEFRKRALRSVLITANTVGVQGAYV